LDVVAVLNRLFVQCDAFVAECYVTTSQTTSLQHSWLGSPPRSRRVVKSADQLAAIIHTCGERFLLNLLNIAEILKASQQTPPSTASSLQAASPVSSNWTAMLSTVAEDNLPPGTMERFMQSCEDLLTIFATRSSVYRVEIHRVVGVTFQVFAERPINTIRGVMEAICCASSPADLGIHNPLREQQTQTSIQKQDYINSIRLRTLAQTMSRKSLLPLSSGLLLVCMRHPLIHAYPYLVNGILKCFAAVYVGLSFPVHGEWLTETAVAGLYEQNDTVNQFLEGLHQCLLRPPRGGQRLTGQQKSESNSALLIAWDYQDNERMLSSLFVALAPLTVSHNPTLMGSSRSLLRTLLRLEAVRMQYSSLDEQQEAIDNEITQLRTQTGLDKSDILSFRDILDACTLQLSQSYSSSTSSSTISTTSTTALPFLPVIPFLCLQSLVNGMSMFCREGVAMSMHNEQHVLSMSNDLLEFLYDLLSWLLVLLTNSRKLTDSPIIAFTSSMERWLQEFTRLLQLTLSIFPSIELLVEDQLPSRLLQILLECCSIDSSWKVACDRLLQKANNGRSATVLSPPGAAAVPLMSRGNSTPIRELVTPISITSTSTSTITAKPLISTIDLTGSDHVETPANASHLISTNKPADPWHFMRPQPLSLPPLPPTTVHKPVSTTTNNVPLIKRRFSMLDRLAELEAEEEEMNRQAATKYLNKRFKINTNAITNMSRAKDPKDDDLRRILAEQEQEQAALRAKFITKKAAERPVIASTDSASNTVPMDDAITVVPQPILKSTSSFLESFFDMDNFQSKSSTTMKADDKRPDQDVDRFKVMMEKLQEIQNAEMTSNILNSEAQNNEALHVSKALLSVSANEILAEIFKLKFADIMGDDDTPDIATNVSSKQPSSASETSSLPVKFGKEDQYIAAFQPLLVDEFKASLQAILRVDLQSGSSSIRDRNDKDKLFRRRRDGSNPENWELNVRPFICDETPQSSNNGQVINDDGTVATLLVKPVKFRVSDEAVGVDRDQEMIKDDLVIVLRPLKNQQRLTRKDLLTLKHCFGLVQNTPRQSSRTLAAESIRSRHDTFTVLLPPTQNPKPEQELCFIPVMNLSTFLREWTALLSIKNKALFPLAPYLMFASPSVSSQLLRYSRLLVLLPFFGNLCRCSLLVLSMTPWKRLSKHWKSIVNPRTLLVCVRWIRNSAMR
jgi:hypothetical protein